MSTKTKTLAKSLHTVTALQRVGRLHWSLTCSGTAAEAIADAMRTLGYEGAADPYGLADRATAALAAELAS